MTIINPNKPVYLFEFEPWDPSAGGGAGALMTLRLSAGSETPHYGGQFWMARGLLGQGFGITEEGFQNRFGMGSIPPTITDLTFANQDGALDHWIDYSWSGRKVTIYKGTEGADFASFKAVFKGFLTAPKSTRQVFSFGVESVVHRLNKNVSLPLFLGTGGIEGADNQKGKEKPLNLGHITGHEPLLIDAVDNVYMLNHRAISEVIGATIAGHVITYDGDVADVWAWVPIAGHFVSDIAKGIIRMGMQVNGLLAVEFRGDAVGGYISSAAQIAKRLVTDFCDDLTAADILDASVTALDTANSSPIGLKVTPEMTLLQAMDSALKNVGAFIRDEVGQLQFKRWENAASLATLKLSRYRNLEIMGRVPAAWRYALGYNRVETVHGSGQIGKPLSGDIEDLGALATQDYVQTGAGGNIYNEAAQKLTDAQIITALGQAASTAYVSGLDAATIRAYAETGNDLTLDNLVKLHPSSLPDGLYTIGGITYIDQIYQANGEFLWNTDGAAGVQIVAGADAGGFYFGCGAANDTRPIFIGQSGYTPYIQFSGGMLFVNPTYNYKALVIRNTKENSQSAIELQTFSGLFAGELYGATTGEIGFLNSGGGWSMRWNYVYDWFSVTTRFRSGIINHYNDSDNYRGFLGWHTLQFGNNGPNYIVAGNTVAGGYLDIYVNNTSDYVASGSINGALAARFGSDGRTYLYGHLYVDSISARTGSLVSVSNHWYFNAYEIFGVSKYKLYSGAYIGNHPNNAYFAFSSATGVYGAILGYSNNQSVFHGYYYWDPAGIGILNSNGNWVFLAHMGNAGFEMRHQNIKVLESTSGGVIISSYLYAVDVYATSLREWKREIETVSHDKMHELLMGMNPCTHGWNPKFGPANDTSIRHLGFIQDEMRVLWPELTEHRGIAYQKITVPLVAGYQRHEGQIKALQDENARVWAILNDLRSGNTGKVISCQH